jgi:hypothetical protein
MEDEFSDQYVKEAEETSFECDGKIVAAGIEERKIEATGEMARYLMLEIQPTSFTGDNLKRQYKIAKQKKGKYIPFLKGLQVCGVPLTGGPSTLIGKEFHWQQITVTKFEKDGEDIEVQSLVPTKLLSGGVAQPSPQKQLETGTHAPKLDANAQKVLDFIRKTGGTTISEVESTTGMTKGAVITALGQLKEAKIVKQEGSALMVA